MQIHELKCWPAEFWAIERGDKRVEVRVDDRDFAVGDLLLLTLYVPSKHEFTNNALLLGETRDYGDYITAELEEDPAKYLVKGGTFAEQELVQIMHITRGRFLAEGFVALSIARAKVEVAS